MNTNHTTHVYCLEGLAVILDEETLTDESFDCTGRDANGLTGRGDELDEAAKLQKVAVLLETKHMGNEANVVKEYVRELVAKQLNEFDGFDR